MESAPIVSPAEAAPKTRGLLSWQPNSIKLLVGVVFGSLFLTALPEVLPLILEPLDAALGLQPIQFTKWVYGEVSRSLALALLGLNYAIAGLLTGFLGLKAIYAGSGLFDTPTPKRRNLHLFKVVVLGAMGAIFLATLLGSSGSLFAVPALLTGDPTLILIASLSKFISIVGLATGEEVLFRSIIFGGLLKRFSAKGDRNALIKALMISSILFSAVHILVHGFTFETFILKMLLGVILAVQYHRTGSLHVPAATHAAYNFAVSL